MSKEEILQALQMVAMGRPRHPFAEQLAEKLAECFAEPKAVIGGFTSKVAGQVMPIVPVQVYEAPFPQLAPPGTPDPVQAVKRGPGRPKKAE